MSNICGTFIPTIRPKLRITAPVKHYATIGVCVVVRCTVGD
jgi:hypothetical protein